MKNHLLLTLLIFTVFCNNSFGQIELELIKPKNPIFSIPNTDNFALLLFVDDLKYKYGEKTAAHIVKYANEKNWPSAINTLDKRNKPETQKTISKYKMYNIGLVRVGLGAYIYLMFIPKDENEKMPEGFKPETDLFFCTDDKAEITSKKNLFDFRREDYLVNEYYMFVCLPKIIDSYNKESEKMDLLIKNAQGENVYKSRLYLSDFYENTMVESHGKLHYMGYYDAGTDRDQAKELYKKIHHQILSGEFHACNFSSSPMNKTFEVEADELLSAKIINTSLIALRLHLVENKYLENTHKTQSGYSIILKVIEQENPKDILWNELSDKIEKEMKAEGYLYNYVFKAKSRGLEGEVSLGIPYDCKWVIYVSSQDVKAQVLDNEGRVVKEFDAPVPYKDIFKITGTGILNAGSYKFSSEKNIDRWLMCFGERYAEAAQKEHEEKVKKEKELWEWAKTGLKQQLEKDGYTIFEERELSTSLPETFQNVSVYGKQKIQLMIVTNSLTLSIDATNEQGVTVAKSKVTANKELYFHGLYIEAPKNELNSYKINFNYGNEKYHNCYMYVGTKK